jgi:fermentation-respiration switch protein FrsA (DUF1100 family)
MKPQIFAALLCASVARAIPRPRAYQVAVESGSTIAEDSYRLFYPSQSNWLLPPPGPPFPLVVLLHGAGTPGIVTDPASPYVGQAENNGEQYDAVAKLLASRGYVVIASDRKRLTIDPTAAPSFNPLTGELTFGLASASEGSPSQIEDCVQTVIALNTDEASPVFNKVDVANIALWGHSAGGRTALTAINTNEGNCAFPACTIREGVDESLFKLGLSPFTSPPFGVLTITSQPPPVTYRLSPEVQSAIKAVILYGPLYPPAYPYLALVASVLPAPPAAIFGVDFDFSAIVPTPPLKTDVPVFILYGDGDNVISTVANPFAPPPTAAVFADLFNRIDGPNKGLLEFQGLIHGAPETIQDSLRLDQPQLAPLAIGHEVIAQASVRHLRAYLTGKVGSKQRLCRKQVLDCLEIKKWKRVQLPCIVQVFREFADSATCPAPA